MEVTLFSENSGSGAGEGTQEAVHNGRKIRYIKDAVLCGSIAFLGSAALFGYYWERKHIHLVSVLAGVFMSTFSGAMGSIAVHDIYNSCCETSEELQLEV